MAITYITQRTATSGTAASGANYTVTVPTGTVPTDILLLAVASAATTTPATPTGWTRLGTFSAGTNQGITIYYAVYSPALTLTFTNVAALSAWVMNAFSGVNIFKIIDTSAAASNTGNNTTLPTGAPTSGLWAGDYEVLCYAWTSGATITTVAAGSTISRTQANGTAISCAMGFNNTTSINASTTVTAFNQTLSANNNRKTGVGVLLRPYVGLGAGVGHPFFF